jgi:hypothetical protein
MCPLEVDLNGDNWGFRGGLATQLRVSCIFKTAFYFLILNIYIFSN